MPSLQERILNEQVLLLKEQRAALQRAVETAGRQTAVDCDMHEAAMATAMAACRRGEAAREEEVRFLFLYLLLLLFFCSISIYFILIKLLVEIVDIVVKVTASQLLFKCIAFTWLDGPGEHLRFFLMNCTLFRSLRTSSFFKNKNAH